MTRPSPSRMATVARRPIRAATRAIQVTDRITGMQITMAIITHRATGIIAAITKATATIADTVHTAAK
ncbi:MAG: hypothetical protein P8H62_00055 [Henriciella sp.]|nr:hypothetical protein [Henriciella sp.]